MDEVLRNIPGLCMIIEPCLGRRLFFAGRCRSIKPEFRCNHSCGPWGFSLNLSGYEDGRSADLGATYGIDLGGVATLKIGPALSFERNFVAGDEVQIGGRLSLERYAPTRFGSIYGLADISSINNSWFMLGQLTLDRGLGFALSRGGSDSYTETTAAIQQQLGGGPVRLRLGYRFEDDEIFLGISVNTF